MWDIQTTPLLIRGQRRVTQAIQSYLQETHQSDTIDGQRVLVAGCTPMPEALPS